MSERTEPTGSDAAILSLADTVESSQNAELRLATAERLLEIAAAVGSESDLAAILDTLFEAIIPLVPFDRMEYATEEGMELTTRWVRSTYTPRLIDVGFTFRRQGDTGRPALDDPYIDYDMAELAARRPPGHPSRLLAAEGIRTGLCCPLGVKGRRVGYLFFGSRHPDSYDELHLWAMSRIAGVVAGAIATGELREQVARRNRELEDAARFQADLLSAISHELRTPLTSVVGLAGALREGLDGFDEEEVRQLAGTIASESTDAAGIVEDLLVVGRAQAGFLEVGATRVDLGHEAAVVIDGLDRHVRLEGAGVAVADPGRVRQILRNLVTNALRYGGSTVWVEVEQLGDRCEVRVRDDGDGLPEEARERVFRPYQRNGQPPGGEGSGLGLWVSRELATRMGGSLSYRHDGGSCFVLELPTP